MLGLGLQKKSTMIGSSGMMIGKREDEIVPDEAIQDPAEQQYREAFALAGEANRTMAEAKEAVRKLRLARGYFAPESVTGKGSAPPSMRSGPDKSPGSKGSGKTPGACFTCGGFGHSYKVCPDPFSKGQFKGGG